MAKKQGKAAELNIFSRVPMFEFLEMEELERLYSLCSKANFAKGDYIFLECDSPHNLYIVSSGEVKLLKQTEDGRETIVEMAYEGEVFGEEAIFDGRPYPMTAQALSDVELLSVSRGDFFSFLRDNPDIALEIIAELAERLREAQNTIRALAMERVEWRIARILLILSRKAGVAGKDGVSINLSLTRQDIADMAAATVETTIRVLSNFKKLGLVDTEKGKIILRDRNQLDSMVSEGCKQR